MTGAACSVQQGAPWSPRCSPVAATSQLFFDDTYTSAVYSDGPYLEFGEPDTLLADDGIAGNIDISGAVLQLSVADTVNGRGTLGLLNVGV